MQRGDVRASPRVFPWTLYPPAVLKIHMFTPVHGPDGERIGGWVVGFKLHWLSQFLSSLRMDGDCMSAGCFCFIVERETGNLIATSDPTIAVLTNDDTTNGEPIQQIKAMESSDLRVAAIAEEVVNANGGDWTNVHNYKSQSDIEVESSIVQLAIDKVTVSQPFIMTSDFTRMTEEPMNSTVTDVPYGINWVVVLSIPEEVVMDSINDKKTKNSFILVGYSFGLWTVQQMVLPLLIGLLVGAHIAKANRSGADTGVPGAGVGAGVVGSGSVDGGSDEEDINLQDLEEEDELADLEEESSAEGERVTGASVIADY